MISLLVERAGNRWRMSHLAMFYRITNEPLFMTTSSWSFHPFHWHLHHKGATHTLKPSWWSHPSPWHHHEGITPSTVTIMRVSPPSTVTIMRVSPPSTVTIMRVSPPSTVTIMRVSPLPLSPSWGYHPLPLSPSWGYPFHWHHHQGITPFTDTFIMRSHTFSSKCPSHHWGTCKRSTQSVTAPRSERD